MRKLNCLLLVFFISIVVLIINSCTSKNNNSEVKLTVISSLERIGQDEQLFGESEATIKAARNEYESFQVVVGALQKNIQVVNAEISDLKGDEGTIGKENIVLYRPEYVRVGRSSPKAQLPPGLYTDPLIPFENPHTGEVIKPFRLYREFWPGPYITEGHEIYPLPFEVWKGQNQPIWVDVFTPKNATAGDYSGVFTITFITLENLPSSSGLNADTIINKQISIPVNLTVWDFTLPDGPSYKNHFGGVGRLTSWYDADVGSEKYKNIEMNYCKMFTEHRLNPPFPRRLLPIMQENGSLKVIPEHHQELKSFIDEFHVTDFEITHAPINGINDPHRELLDTEKQKIVIYYRDYYQYLKENGWDNRAYVYLYDEPNTSECYARVSELGKLVHEAAPELKVLVVEQPYAEDSSWPNIDEAVDIWCGLFSFIDRDAINHAIDNGDEVWSYTALNQRSPQYHPTYNKVKNYDPPYWNIDAQMISHRVPTWMNYQYNISGILYWALTYRERDDWDPTFRIRYNGDGYFMYPGVPCGIDGPVSSIRLKNLRESMEDYEYLLLLEELVGREEVLKIVSKVAPNWWSTTRDPKMIFSTREMIANEIMKLKK